MAPVDNTYMIVLLHRTERFLFFILENSILTTLVSGGRFNQLSVSVSSQEMQQLLVFAKSSFITTFR